MTDAELARAYKDYAGAVYARGLRILRDRDLARDVTQEVFVRCFGHRRSLGSGPDVLAWLYRVTTNLCLNVIRDKRLRQRTDGDLLRQSPPFAGPEGPSRRGLWDLLAGVDARTQAIVVHVHLDGMTQAEAAAVAGVSDRTVRKCLARFERHVRERLAADVEPILVKEPS
jgi:RNA polymerase sigma-70 factor (ECF subfamily)